MYDALVTLCVADGGRVPVLVGFDFRVYCVLLLLCANDDEILPALVGLDLCV